MAEHEWRLGVDIGGTFTDVVLEGPTGITSTKVLTTYAAPEDAILEGIATVCDQAEIAPGQVGQIIHGTTLATNALIERRGAKTALITTEGFRDVIEMRTESRFEQYDLNLVLPEPLLPRQFRFTVPERVDANGTALIPFDRAAVEEVADRIATAGFESVAVGLLHSYLNPAHERMVREVLVQRCPGVSVSLSSDVSPQMREYERFNTTVANAYIKPLMHAYLTRLEERLRAQGVRAQVFMIHSGGGIMALEDAAEFPVRLVESGPAGGAVFAAHIAARHGLDKVLSFDMGGTTAKICLIKNQTPRTARVFEVARSYRFKKGSGMPISIPVIDMVEIGAGGGSLAHVDALRQIRVGPESAGSEPGPACYGRGGARPAVTDADLVLGKLDPKNFAGGAIALDPSASKAVFVAEIGERLAMDATEAAFGVAEVVDENMANAARVHAVENGEDLSEYTMIAFGGAAPLHAARLCEKLGIERCLVPPGAGVGSAIGFLRAPFSFEATRSVYMKLSDFDALKADTLISELTEEATGFVRSCDADAPIETITRVYMRYTGQGWEIPVEVGETLGGAALEQLFEAEYTKLFARPIAGLDVEITVWAVNATTPPEEVAPVERLNDGETAVIDGKCSFFDAAEGTFVPGYKYDRETLPPGRNIDFPARIYERETTIILPLSRRAICQPDGCIEMIRKGDA
ncbi:MAG: hydantoinase/oxoprolinase family protein [Shimia sp.]